MKKLFATLLVLIASFVLVGCTNDAPSTLTEVEDRGYFIVGLDDTFAPMGFRDNDGNIVGFDVDLAKAFADRLGVEVRFQPIDWDAKVLELNSGTIDMIWNGLTITDSRLEEMSFSDAYIANTQLIMTADGSTITTIADLAGKTIGVQTSSAAEEAVEASDAYDTFGEVLTYDDYNQALLELQNGLIDAVVIDEIMGRYIISQSDYSYQVATENFGAEQYGIGFRLEATELRDAFNQVLAEMIADGSAAEISENWFNEDIFLD